MKSKSHASKLGHAVDTWLNHIKCVNSETSCFLSPLIKNSIFAPLWAGPLRLDAVKVSRRGELYGASLLPLLWGVTETQRQIDKLSASRWVLALHNMFLEITYLHHIRLRHRRFYGDLCFSHAAVLEHTIPALAPCTRFFPCCCRHISPCHSNWLQKCAFAMLRVHSPCLMSIHWDFS